MTLGDAEAEALLQRFVTITAASRESAAVRDEPMSLIFRAEVMR